MADAFMNAAFDPTQPFTHQEAARAGISDRALRGALYRRVFPNVYVANAIPDTLVVRCRAALRVVPTDAVFSHATAARLWGGWVPDDPNVHVAFTRSVSCQLTGIKVHRFTHQFDKGIRRHGLPVTSPEQTVLHLTRGLGLVDLVACADQLVRRNVTTPQDLAVAAATLEGQGRNLAGLVAEFARDRVDSSTESRLRMLMVLGGLPEPVVNLALLRPDGTVEYRLDLAYPEWKLAIEYDGRWHASPEQTAADEARRHDLANRGWTVVVIRAEELFDAPAETLAALYALLRQHGIPTPCGLGHGWRRHFPTRTLTT